MKKVNITIELRDDEHVYHFEKFIREEVKVLDFRILPDTSELYEKDEYFRKIISAVKEATLIRDRYINDHNFD